MSLMGFIGYGYGMQMARTGTILTHWAVLDEGLKQHDLNIHVCRCGRIVSSVGINKTNMYRVHNENMMLATF